MKNRLLLKLKQAQVAKTKSVCIFLTLGYPSLKATEQLIKRLEGLGVDLIELGFPFSDPLADGPTIQQASEAALRKGVHFLDALRLVRKLRKDGVRIPIIFFTYFNPVFRIGFKSFTAQIRKAGFDGVIVPDLPPDEELDFQKRCASQDLALVFLMAPTTRPARARMIARHSKGFVYYVSLRGVTGARRLLHHDVASDLKRLRKTVKCPILIGFGVSTPAQGRYLSRMSEGVIVGSAFIDRLRRDGGRLEGALRLAGSMVKSVKGS